MDDPPDKIEQVASKIAGAVFSAIIIAIVFFLWINSSASFKQDSLSGIATLLTNAKDFVSHKPLGTTLTATPETMNKASAQKHKKNSKTKATATAEQSGSDKTAAHEIAMMPVPPFATPSAPKIPKVVRHGKPVQFFKRTVAHIPLYETIIDLQDPETFIAMGLANNAARANDSQITHGDESFESLVKKAHASVVMNGTFFSKDDQKRVMGNMVSGGKIFKYSQWEHMGTTLGLTQHNQPVMITANAEGKPDWSEHWFSLTCGPRLLKNGGVWAEDPTSEGFTDPHVMGIGPRCAIGITPAHDKLILCTFMNGLSLPEEARLMKELGCSEAMNLDGGASRALAHNGSIVVPAGRPLTNVLIVYDSKNKAPQKLIDSWEQFQEIRR